MQIILNIVWIWLFLPCSSSFYNVSVPVTVNYGYLYKFIFYKLGILVFISHQSFNDLHSLQDLFIVINNFLRDELTIFLLLKYKLGLIIPLLQIFKFLMAHLIKLIENSFLAWLSVLGSSVLQALDFRDRTGELNAIKFLVSLWALKQVASLNIILLLSIQIYLLIVLECWFLLALLKAILILVH